MKEIKSGTMVTTLMVMYIHVAILFGDQLNYYRAPESKNHPVGSPWSINSYISVLFNTVFVYINRCHSLYVVAWRLGHIKRQDKDRIIHLSIFYLWTFCWWKSYWKIVCTEKPYCEMNNNHSKWKEDTAPKCKII